MTERYIHACTCRFPFPPLFWNEPTTCFFVGNQIEADAARAEGTTVYAVGVGTVPAETLEAIGGGPENVFDTSDFEGLDGESRGEPSYVML